MRMSLALALMALMLAACSSIEPKEFRGPNGGRAFSMTCSGMGRTLHDCYQAAGKLCPGGYSVVDSRSTPVGVPVSGGTLIASNDTLAIECR